MAVGQHQTAERRSGCGAIRKRRVGPARGRSAGGLLSEEGADGPHPQARNGFRRDAKGLPTSDLPPAGPEFHCAGGTPLVRLGDGGSVGHGLELAELLDVAAAVQEIKSVVRHWSSPFSRRERREEKIYSREGSCLVGGSKTAAGIEASVSTVCTCSTMSCPGWPSPWRPRVAEQTPPNIR